LLDEETFAGRRDAVLEALAWQGPVYSIAAIRGEGTDVLCGDLMTYLEECRARELADSELAETESELQTRMQEEARQRIDDLRALRRQEARDARDDSDDDFDDDDFDVEVEYVP
jgi:GTP-binding protein